MNRLFIGILVLLLSLTGHAQIKIKYAELSAGYILSINALWKHRLAEPFILHPELSIGGSLIEKHIEWNIENITYSNEVKAYSSGDYYVVHHNFKIRREGATVTITVLIPGMSICFLGLLYVLLPRGDGGRVPYLATIMLTEIMFLVMMTQFVPIAK